jgi:hypothetical protein
MKRGSKNGSSRWERWISFDSRKRKGERDLGIWRSLLLPYSRLTSGPRKQKNPSKDSGESSGTLRFSIPSLSSKSLESRNPESRHFILHSVSPSLIATLKSIDSGFQSSSRIHYRSVFFLRLRRCLQQALDANLK